MVDASDALRVAADYSLLGRVLLGECPYACYLITIANDQIVFNALPSSPTITKTRLTVAQGFLSFAPGDGYLNPPTKQLSGEQLVLSGGALTDNMVVIGPFTFPYGNLGISGGLDPSVFQPVNSNTNNQVFVLITAAPSMAEATGSGLGLNATIGNYFEVKQILLDDMKNVTYRVLLSATNSTPFT